MKNACTNWSISSARRPPWLAGPVAQLGEQFVSTAIAYTASPCRGTVPGSGAGLACDTSEAPQACGRGGKRRVTITALRQLLPARSARTYRRRVAFMRRLLVEHPNRVFLLLLTLATGYWGTRYARARLAASATMWRTAQQPQGPLFFADLSAASQAAPEPSRSAFGLDVPAERRAAIEKLREQLAHDPEYYRRNEHARAQIRAGQVVTRDDVARLTRLA
jgi:hypothetical protein